MNRLTSAALIVIGCILILFASAVGVVLRLHESRLEAEQAGAMLDIADESMSETVTIEQGHFFKPIFREPFEKVIFFFRDGTFLVFSTGHDKAIRVPVSWVYDYITKECGYKIEDCLFVVHNHFTPAGFTEPDLQTYQYLYRQGFRGVFGIYYPATGHFRAVED